MKKKIMLDFMLVIAVCVVAMTLLFAAVKRVTGHALPGRISAAVVSEVIMVVGYFFYAGLILGKGLAAAASIPGNIVQGVFGVVTATVVATLLSHTKLMRQAGPEGRTA